MNTGISLVPDEARLRRKAELEREYLRQLQTEKLRFYKPYDKQLAFHMAQQPIRGFAAGNKTGKTFSVSIDDLWTLGRCHPYRPNFGRVNSGRVCCVTTKTLYGTMLPIWKQLVPRKRCKLDYKTYEGIEAWWPGLRGDSWDTAFDKTNLMLHLADESFVEFKSYDQDVDTYAGPVRDWIHEDEEAPEDIHNENMARFLTSKVDLRMSMTPLNYSHYAFNLLWERSVSDPKNVFLVEASVHDNPYINPDVIAEMEKTVLDPSELAARLHGRPTFQTGLVWKTYGNHNLIKHFTPTKDKWSLSFSIDPHREKDTHVLWIAQSVPPNPIYYIYREKRYPSGLGIPQIAKDIYAESRGEEIEIELIDESARQSNRLIREETIFDEFRRYMPRLESISNQGKDKIRETILQLAQEAPVGDFRSHLLVSDRCQEAHRQLSTYSYAPPTKSGEDRTHVKVIKKREDYCDCLIQRVGYGEIDTSYDQNKTFPVVGGYGR